MQDAVDALPHGDDGGRNNFGHIHITDPPVHYVADQRVEIGGGIEVSMDGFDHRAYAAPRDESNDSLIPWSQTGENYIQVTKNAGQLFVPPNVDNEIVPLWNIHGLSVQGPGQTVMGSAFVRGNVNSNKPDLSWIHYNFIRWFDRGVNLAAADSPKVYRNVAQETGREAIITSDIGEWVWRNHVWRRGHQYRDWFHSNA